MQVLGSISLVLLSETRSSARVLTPSVCEEKQQGQPWSAGTGGASEQNFSIDVLIFFLRLRREIPLCPPPPQHEPRSLAVIKGPSNLMRRLLSPPDGAASALASSGNRNGPSLIFVSLSPCVRLPG